MDLLAVGRLEHQKGFDLLVEAMGAVVAERPGVATLSVVGAGSARPALQARIDELGLAGSAILSGAVPAASMPARYRRADAVVMPARFDASSLVLYEAWREGRPVVASAAGAVPDVATDREDALVVPVGDVPALARAIIEVIDDAGLRARLGAAGRARWAQLPTWQSVAGRYGHLYASLGGGPAR